MKMSADGVALLQASEGCRLTCYRDARGVPTIGWGSTLGLGAADVGVKTIAQGEADALLHDQDLPRYEAGVAAVVKVPLNQKQADALIDFAYNLGVGALAGSTLLRKLNAGDVAGASAEFPKWCHAGTEVLPGLVRRRARERALFDGGRWQDAP